MTVTLPAYAKINLTLEVLGRRPDGYHEIVTILQAISLHDTIRAEEGATISVDSPELGCEPADNLVARAACLLQAEHAPGRGAHLHLEKRIPAAAGLGGGSSDAACTLVALNRLWQLKLQRDRLSSLAARLGSDVPFFLDGPTALARGRGEMLEELPPLDTLWLVLVVPPVDIPAKTRSLYGALTPADFTNGQAGLEVAASLRSGRGLDISMLRNVFERPAFALYPEIRRHRDSMLRCGAESVRLSGSGPALFSLTADETEARRIAGALAVEGTASTCARLMGREYARAGAI